MCYLNVQGRTTVGKGLQMCMKSNGVIERGIGRKKKTVSCFTLHLFTIGLYLECASSYPLQSNWHALILYRTEDIK